MKKMNKKGFTIVELVIVIAVIAILAAVLIPTFSGVVARANESAALQTATSAMKATLAMSNSATLKDGTQFILVENGKVSYRFDYQNNKIGTFKETELPDNYNSVIVRGTTANDKTTIAAADWALIVGAGVQAPTDHTYVANNMNESSDGSYFTYKQGGETNPNYVLLNNGEFGNGTETNNKDKVVKFFINIDYPANIVTVTNSY